MTRVKRGTTAHKRREKVLKYAKGFKWGRKSKERLATDALLHAWTHAFSGRKQKKRDYRALWQSRIGAAAKAEGMNYSKLMSALKKKNIELDRKVLSEIANTQPNIFKQVIAMAK